MLDGYFFCGEIGSQVVKGIQFAQNKFKIVTIEKVNRINLL